jgi:hypothetical protein
MTTSWFDVLKKHSFSNPSSKILKKNLENESVLFQSTRNLQKHFQRRADVEVDLGERWQMDLADLGSGKAFNIKEGEKKPSLLALVCIDLFSKMIYSRGLKNKTAGEVSKALEEIFNEAGKNNLPKVIQSDGGGEFDNRKMRALLIKYDISFDIRGGYLKNQVVERSIRSFKKIAVLYIESHWDEFKKNWKENWIKLVPLINNILNKRVNRSIQCEPEEVINNLNKVRKIQINKKNFTPLTTYFKLLKDLSEGKPIVDGKKKFKLGDFVLVQHEKARFEKETRRNYLYKPWKIVFIAVARKPFLYALKDTNNRKAKRLFYAKELISAPKMPIFPQIPSGKILDSRTKDGKKENLVEKMDLGKPLAEWT